MPVDILIFSANWVAFRMHEVERYGRSQIPGDGDGMYSFNGARAVYLSRSLGPEKISWRIRQAGYTCQVLSFAHYYSDQQFKDLISKFVGPKTIVAVSSVFIQDQPSIQAIADIFKRYVPKQNKTMIGGQGAHIWNDIIKRTFNYNFDYVINGFAENDIVSFMHKHFNNGIQKKNVPFWEITSCNFRWSPDAFVFPTEALPLETARGCIFECKFCRYNMLGKKKGTYVRNMELIREELIHNYNLFGTTDYMLTDDTFNDTPGKVEAWADMVHTLPFKIRYVAYIRADLLHRYPHTIPLLKDSGLLSAHFGIETIQPRSSKTIGKAWSGKHGKDYVPYVRDVLWNKDVLVHVSLINGLPYETIKDWDITKKWVEDNKIDAFTRALDVRLKSRDLIDKTDSKNGTSIFDREAEKYGYKMFDTGGATDLWEINGITYWDAHKYALKANYDWTPFVRAGHYVGFELTSIGIPWETIMTTPKYKLMSDRSLYKKAEGMVDQYVEKLLSM